MFCGASAFISLRADANGVHRDGGPSGIRTICEQFIDQLNNINTWKMGR